MRTIVVPLGPHVLDAQEDLYRAVAFSGLDGHDVVRVTGLLKAHVFGAARSRINDVRATRDTGMSADDYWESRTTSR